MDGWMNEWTEQQQQGKDKFVQFHHCHNIALVRWGREGRNGERERWTKSWCKRTGSGKSEVCVFSAYCSLPSSFLPKSLFSSIFYRFAKKGKEESDNNSSSSRQTTDSVWTFYRLLEMKYLSIRNLTTWTTRDCQLLFRINDKWISLISFSISTTLLLLSSSSPNTRNKAMRRWTKINDIEVILLCCFDVETK